MQEKTKPVKRIVSKQEYARYVGKATLGVNLFYVLLIAGLVCIGVVLIIGYFCLTYPIPPKTVLPRNIFMAIFGGMGVLLCFLARATWKKVSAMEKVVPVTRQNVGLLPVQESLVRASSEPTITQQDALLRAAENTSVTPAEELLRPHV